MSKQYENRIAAEIDENTNDNVAAYRCGYSGNNRMPQPDVLVTTASTNFALELKKRKGKYAYIEPEDLEQLVECRNSYTEAHLVLKFPRYEPVCMKYFDDITGEDDWNELSIAERFAAVAPECFEATTTDGGFLRLTNPREFDGWQSTQSGREDWEAICDDVGIVHAGSIEVSF